MCNQQSLRSACAYAQSDQNLCSSLEYSMTPRLLTEKHLEFLSLTGGCTGSSESTLVKMPHCWKSHAVAQILWWFCVWFSFCNAVFTTCVLSSFAMMLYFVVLLSYDFECSVSSSSSWCCELVCGL